MKKVTLSLLAISLLPSFVLCYNSEVKGYHLPPREKKVTYTSSMCLWSSKELRGYQKYNFVQLCVNKDIDYSLQREIFYLNDTT